MRNAFVTIVFVLIFQTVRADITQVEFDLSNYLSTGSGSFSSHDDSVHNANPYSPNASFDNTLQYTATYSDGGVTEVAKQKTAGSFTQSTYDVTATLSAETDNSRGSGHGSSGAGVDSFFTINETCYFTCSGNFTADDSTLCAAEGDLTLTFLYNSSGSSSQRTIYYIGEGDFSSLPPSSRPGHSGSISGLLAPGTYRFTAGAHCSGPNGSLGTNGSATASIALHVTAVPKVPPTVTFTMSHDGSGDASLGVDSRSGLDYQLQGSDGLAQWDNIGSPQAGTGARMNFPVTFAPTAPNAHFFYRLLVGLHGSSGTPQSRTSSDSIRGAHSDRPVLPNKALQRTEAGG